MSSEYNVNQVELPEEIAKKFNWGAFLLTWIWGLGNKAYITLTIFLVSLIPFVNIIATLGMSIWFGIRGNEWAWQNKKFNSIEDFEKYQKKWTIAGVIVTAVIILLSLLLYLVAFTLLSTSTGSIN